MTAPLGEAYGLMDHIVVQEVLVGTFPTPTRTHCPDDGPRPQWLLSKFHCSRDHTLQARYGITCDDYWGLFEAQGGRCAICRGQPGQGRKLVVDHDHDTGVIDGLAHFGCNRRLSTQFRRYLADPPGRSAGLVVPAAKLRYIEDLNKAKRARTRARTRERTNEPTSQLDKMRTMTQGGA